MRVAAAVAIVAGASLSAQVPPAPVPPPPARGVIVGQVVDGAGGAPVAGALVTLTPAPGGLASVNPGEAISIDQLMSVNIANVMAGVRQTLADGQGRFAFTSLTPGAVSLAATKPGYSGGAYGQRRSDGGTIPLILAADARLGDVTLRLWKNAAISGRVVDEAGEPIVGVNVRVLKRTWAAGRSRLSPAGSAPTDDRGIYRVGALRPGEYVAVIAQTSATVPAGGGGMPAIDPAAIQSMMASSGVGADPNALLATLNAAMGSASGGGIRVGDWVLRTSVLGGRLIPPAPVGTGRMAAYRTTFYPDASLSSQASAVAIGPGEDRSGIDFQLRPVPVVQIAGTIVRPDNDARAVQVRLIPAGADDLTTDSGFESATATATSSGAFAFLAVPPGQYTIRVLQLPAAPAAPPGFMSGMSMIENASGNRTVSMGPSPSTMEMMMPLPAAVPAEPTLWAAVQISVADRDVADVAVPLRPAFRVTGRADFEGALPRPTTEQLRRLSIVLDRVDSAIAPNPFAPSGGSAIGQVDQNGQFTTSGALPGKYFIRAPFGVAGWTLKSATLAGRDVTDEALEIDNADVSGVTLTFSDRLGDLSGAVSGAQPRTDGPGSVVVFPVQRDRWVDFGASPRRLRVTKAGADGRYRISALPPGDYFLAATIDDVAADWQNPAFLDTLSRTATRITIADGERKVVDVVAR